MSVKPSILAPDRGHASSLTVFFSLRPVLLGTDIAYTCARRTKTYFILCIDLGTYLYNHATRRDPQLASAHGILRLESCGPTLPKGTQSARPARQQVMNSSSNSSGSSSGRSKVHVQHCTSSTGASGPSQCWYNLAWQTPPKQFVSTSTQQHHSLARKEKRKR